MRKQNKKYFHDMNKKKGGKRKRDNNDFQYQNTNTSEISQSSKDEYLEQQNNTNIQQ